MKIYKKIALCTLTSLLALSPLLTLQGCSSGTAEEEADASFDGVMTVENFASLSKSFQILSTGLVNIVPQTLITPRDQITDFVEVFGYIQAQTTEGDATPVQVLMTYTTSGQATPDSPPTNGVLSVSFSSSTGQNNDSIIRALGFREVSQGHVLSDLEFDFNFIVSSVDIAGAGGDGGTIYPGDGGTTEDTTYEEKIYNRVFTVTRSTF